MVDWKKVFSLRQIKPDVSAGDLYVSKKMVVRLCPNCRELAKQAVHERHDADNRMVLRLLLAFLVGMVILYVWSLIS